MEPDSITLGRLRNEIRALLSIPNRGTDVIIDGLGTGTPPNSPMSSASDNSVADPIPSPPVNQLANSPNPADQRESLFFRRLPPEVRIMIWRELLVTNKVYVSFTNCRLLLAQRGAKRRQRATHEVSEFDEKHVEYYGVLGGDDVIGEEADVGTYFSPRRCHDDWEEYASRSLALQRPPKFRDSYHPRPDLNIFLACRRARNEAEPVFYSENCFTFCTCNQLHDYDAARDISPAHAAWYFFQDRSKNALDEIKNIEFHVLD